MPRKWKKTTITNYRGKKRNYYTTKVFAPDSVKARLKANDICPKSREVYSVLKMFADPKRKGQDAWSVTTLDKGL